MELGLETEGRNKLVSDFVTATFQVITMIIMMVIKIRESIIEKKSRL